MTNDHEMLLSMFLNCSDRDWSEFSTEHAKALTEFYAHFAPTTQVYLEKLLHAVWQSAYKAGSRCGVDVAMDIHREIVREQKRDMP